MVRPTHVPHVATKTGGAEMRKTITILFAVIAIAGASLAGSFVPQWTDYNESDPGITLLRGIDVNRNLWDW